ncbi:ABC transporter permease subunit [Klebsiella aerogenes]|nr:ABC transporter permease subunit [Klebsiella aerogenes]
MAAPLRYALILLTWGAIALIYLPLLPAAALMAAPAVNAEAWRALFSDPQLAQALTATLASTLLAVGGALLITLTVIAALWPSDGWQRLAGRLPLLLAVPHVAFATGALLLFAEGGWLYRLFPALSPLADRYGIGLGLTMAVKESSFLLWVAYGLLGEKQLAAQAVVLKTLGYNRWQCLNWVILPGLLPSMSVVLLATVAWSLSAVDVALVIGPGNPPTLAVLAWQWLNQGGAQQHAKGALVSLLLLALTLLFAAAAWAAWRGWRRGIPDLRGLRRAPSVGLTGHTLALAVPACGLVCALLLGGLSQMTLPSADTIYNSLWLAAGSAILGAVLCLLWLECGPAKYNGLWLPLIIPALPLADGQYQLALYGWLDGQLTTVLWGHLLWVVPWMLFILRPAWRHRDPRQELIARTLGWRRGRRFWLLTLPSLARPILTALAVGFSVSIAQYLPTMWLGGGRTPTLTSEAVALSSGGDNMQLAAQALWQLLLPTLCFMMTALTAWFIGRHRRGLR